MAKKQQEHYLILPGTQDWELFRFGAGQSAEKIPLDALPQKSRKHISLGLPGRWIYSFYLKLQLTERAQLENALTLQLEKNGLPTGKECWGFYDLSQQKTSTSVHLFSMPEVRQQTNLPLPDISPTRVGPVWQCYSFHTDGIYLQQELGRWDLLLVSGGKIAYSRDLSLHTLAADAVGSIQQSILHLQCLEALHTVPTVTVLCPTPPQDFMQRMNAAGIKTRTELPLSPHLPDKWVTLTPEKIRLEFTARQLRSTRQRNGLLTGILLTLLVLAVAVFWFMQNQKWQSVQAKLTALAPTMMQMQEIDARWQQVALAVEPGLYPLESLHRMTKPLPDKGIRVTRFQQNDYIVLIEGEANNAMLVFDWVKSMQDSVDCAHIDFKDPSIKSLPGNKTRFTLQANLRHAPHE
ncbi:MAG: hypothetical protein AAGH72_13040 [Verrucomicrobiota bacterium]